MGLKTAEKAVKKGFKPFLESEKIYLREVRVSDANDAYYSWLNDEDVAKYLETKYRPQSKEMIEEYVKHMQDSDGSVFFAIVEKSSGRHVGNIKLGPVNPYHRYADIALVVGDKTTWGKGYGSQAIALVTEFAFYTWNLNKVCASIFEINKGSLKAFEKAGFKVEGTLVKHRFYEGRYINEYLVARIRPERTRIKAADHSGDPQRKKGRK